MGAAGLLPTESPPLGQAATIAAAVAAVHGWGWGGSGAASPGGGGLFAPIK